MSDQNLLAELQSRGLRAWQATFVASFLNADPSPFQLLTAPLGTGKMFTAVATVRALTASGATRILVLAPASLCEDWRTRIAEAQSHLSVSWVTRREYREMEAAVPIGESPFAANGVFVVSQDFGKQRDIVYALESVAWDLVAVDEAHRLAAMQRSMLVEQLVHEGVVQRLLLLTATPLPALDHWLHPRNIASAPLSPPPAVTSWYGVLRNWDGSAVERPHLDWRVVEYTRGADEVHFLRQMLHQRPLLEEATGGDQFLARLLAHRAASSTFAVEQSLQRWRTTLLSRVANTDAVLEEESDADADSENLEADGEVSSLADTSPVLAVVDRWLQALESVTTDEKLSSLRGLLRSLHLSPQGPTLRVCIVSRYADTIAYLHSALQSLNARVFKITGRDSFADRVAILKEYLRSSGLLICTDAGVTEGIELPEITYVIHYDVPGSEAAVEQRLGRFDRYGRSAGCSMYILRDESGVLPLESRSVDRLVTAFRADDRAARDPDADGSAAH